MMAPVGSALPRIPASRERCQGMKHPRNDRGMSVDVIVPAFNRNEWLVECLNSVIEQSYPNFRLIVVDDGSEPPLSECRSLLPYLAIGVCG